MSDYILSIKVEIEMKWGSRARRWSRYGFKNNFFHWGSRMDQSGTSMMNVGWCRYQRFSYRGIIKDATRRSWVSNRYNWACGYNRGYRNNWCGMVSKNTGSWVCNWNNRDQRFWNNWNWVDRVDGVDHRYNGYDRYYWYYRNRWWWWSCSSSCGSRCRCSSSCSHRFISFGL